jgi:glycosyltransferase involved in cell wall biosynthesis
MLDQSTSSDTTGTPVDSAISAVTGMVRGLRVAVIAKHASAKQRFEGSTAGTAGHVLSLFNLIQAETILIEWGTVTLQERQERTTLWQSRGIGYITIDILDKIPLDRPELRSYYIYQNIKEYDFDLVVFIDQGGAGYYCTLAKNQGLAFSECTIAIVGTELHQVDGRFYLPESSLDLTVDFLERSTIEQADVYWPTTPAIAGSLRAAGWTLPSNTVERTEILLNLHLAHDLEQKPAGTDPHVIICYVSEQSYADDFIDFLRSTSQLFRSSGEEIRKLGTPLVVVCGLPILPLERAALAAFAEQMREMSVGWELSDTVSWQRLRAFAQNGRVLSVVGGSGSAFACAQLAQAGSVVLMRDPERMLGLFDFSTKVQTTFALGRCDLVDAMRSMLQGQSKGTTVASRTFDDIKQTWFNVVKKITPTPVGKLQDELTSSISEKRSDPKSINDDSIISICMPTFNRVDELIEAVASLEKQTDKNFELILVDDGSTSEAALAAQADIVASTSFVCRRLEQSNSGPSVARNLAAEHAIGDYLLFMDDDNVATPHAIETFRRSAATSGADFLTCVAGIHPSSEWGLSGSLETFYAKEIGCNCRFWGPPVGPNVSVGLFYNCFGDCNSLVRKASFLSLGGFKSFMYEDLELFMRAALEGATVVVIPEILYLYRFHRASRSRTERLLEACIESVQPALARVHPALRSTILMARSRMLKEVVNDRFRVLEAGIAPPLGFNGSLSNFLWQIGANAQADAIHQFDKRHAR